MKYRALMLMLPLAACEVAVPPHMVEDRVNRHFSGLPVKQFFEEYGMPQEEITYPGGGVEYRWISTGAMPSRPAPAIDDTYRTVYTAQPIPAGSFCELRITANYERIARRFTVVTDTRGHLTASRCSEIFF